MEYDPNRTAFIALLKYQDGTLVVHPGAAAPRASATWCVAGVKADVKPGNAMQLASMPIGTIVHNIELKAGGGGKIARSAGAYGQLVGRDSGWAILRLNSGETRRVRAECMATVGAVSNPDHYERGRPARRAARAGAVRARPCARIAMNPVDHPNGGRTKGGKHWATPGARAPRAPRRARTRRPTSFIVRPRQVRASEEHSDVARSVWKGPFVDGYLLEEGREACARRAATRSSSIWSRRSTILPQFVGLTFGVYNGQKHVPVNVTEDMIGHKFGEFAPTRTFHGHSGDKKAVRSKPAARG